MSRVWNQTVDALAFPKKKILMKLSASSTRNVLCRPMDRCHYGSLHPFSILIPVNQGIGYAKNRCHIRPFSNLCASTTDDQSELTSNEATSGNFLGTIRNALVESILPHCDESEAVVAVVGVSGGCDSVGLLHALVQLNLPQLRLHAIHFDHRQRSAESDGDREFVAELCSQLQVPLHTYYWEASPDEPFSQDSARTWRRTTMYRLLLQILPSDQHHGILMTAHHRNDSMETLLLKILRGVHISNLVGMDAVVRPIDMPRALWARPMLDVSKEDIQEFLLSQGLSWRDDASNASSKYKRNRIRNELIPLLADIVGSEQLLEKRLETLSQQSRELGTDLRDRAGEYLDKSGSKKSFVLPSSSCLSMVHRDALHLWSKLQGLVLSYDQLRRICNQLESHPQNLQWTIQIGQGWNMVRNGPTLSLLRDGEFETVTEEGEGSKQQPIKWSIAVDNSTADSMHTLIIQRVEVPSDRFAFIISTAGQTAHSSFQPAWRKNPIKLKEFLRGQKVPLHLRDEIPIILEGDDVVAVYVNNKWEHNSALQRGSVFVELSLQAA